MKDLCQYGNQPEDEWEILPWIRDLHCHSKSRRIRSSGMKRQIGINFLHC